MLGKFFSLRRKKGSFKSNLPMHSVVYIAYRLIISKYKISYRFISEFLKITPSDLMRQTTPSISCLDIPTGCKQHLCISFCAVFFLHFVFVLHITAFAAGSCDIKVWECTGLHQMQKTLGYIPIGEFATTNYKLSKRRARRIVLERSLKNKLKIPKFFSHQLKSS